MARRSGVDTGVNIEIKRSALSDLAQELPGLIAKHNIAQQQMRHEQEENQKQRDFKEDLLVKQYKMSALDRIGKLKLELAKLGVSFDTAQENTDPKNTTNAFQDVKNDMISSVQEISDQESNMLHNLDSYQKGRKSQILIDGNKDGQVTPNEIDAWMDLNPDMVGKNDKAFRDGATGALNKEALQILDYMSNKDVLNQMNLKLKGQQGELNDLKIKYYKNAQNPPLGLNERKEFIRQAMVAGSNMLGAFEDAEVGKLYKIGNETVYDYYRKTPALQQNVGILNQLTADPKQLYKAIKQNPQMESLFKSSFPNMWESFERNITQLSTNVAQESNVIEDRSTLIKEGQDENGGDLNLDLESEYNLLFGND